MAEICKKNLKEKRRDGEQDSEHIYSLFLRNQVKKEKAGSFSGSLALTP